jgi:polyferredoxin
MMKKHLIRISTIGCIVLMVLILMTSCLPGTRSSIDQKPAGFFMGIWHGWIAPISLIGHFFNGEIRIYEPNNTGWWYDFGFYMAIVGGFGGLSLARKKGHRTYHRDEQSR